MSLRLFFCHLSLGANKYVCHQHKSEMTPRLERIVAKGSIYNKNKSGARMEP